MAKTAVICYKLKNPVIYNKGTKWERGYDTFLAYQTYKPLYEAELEADDLNMDMPETLWNGERIDWDNIDYFFAQEQEAMY